MVTIDRIDIKDVHWIEDKIDFTLYRLNNLKKWQAPLRFYTLKSWCVYKLRSQLDFLLRVQKVKMADL